MNNSGFTYHISTEGSGFARVEEKGLLSYQVFLDEFEHYPHQFECDQRLTGSDVTLTVKRVKDSVEMFFSKVGSAQDFAFLVGLAEPVDCQGDKHHDNSTLSVKVYITEQEQDVKALFALFFKGEYQALQQSLNHLPLFLE